MIHQLKLYCPTTGRRYILLHRGAQPLLPGEYEEVPLEKALRLVFGATTGQVARPERNILLALGITEHPANVSSGELSARVSRVLFGIPRWQLLREIEHRALAVAKPALLPKSSAPFEPASEPRAYVGVEIISEEGEPLQGVRIEFTLPDGSVRSMASDEQGRALATGIEPGTCGITLPALDANRWRPSGGSHAVVRSEPTLGHIVQQGECISQIAHQYGLGSWEKIWNHSENGPLKQKRKSPHVLLPGDEVRLPGIEIAQIERPNDAMHRIVVSVKPLEVELVLTFKDGDGEPLKDEPYELTYQHVGKEEKRAGSLDESGKLRETLPVTLRSVLLSLSGRSELYDILLGHLDPGLNEQSIPVESGAIGRLRGLGFVSREPGEDGHLDLRAGIKAFQEQVMGRAEPTGELDAATCAKLEEAYGA